jgi:hypothetical protein
MVEAEPAKAMGIAVPAAISYKARAAEGGGGVEDDDDG